METTTNYAQMNDDGQPPISVVIGNNQQHGPPGSMYAEDGTLYWLACICCNACGLTAVALILHHVAESMWEQKNFAGSSNLWEKARKLRNYGIAISCAAIIIMVICYTIFTISFTKAIQNNNNG
eukprot:344042_1